MKKTIIGIFIFLFSFNFSYGLELNDDDYYLVQSGYSKEEFQIIYDTVVSGVKNVSINCQPSKPVLLRPGISFVIQKALLDYDHLNYMSGVRYVYNKKNKNIKNLYFDHYYLRDDIKKKIKITNDKVDEIILQTITPSMSDYDKILAIHDYIINTTKYDYDSFITNNIPDYRHRAYGALIDKQAVCDGYARAFKLIMSKLNIPTSIVKGNNHAWNIVKLDDKFYHIDLTYDDPYKEDKDILTYDYFLIPDEEISKDHLWDYRTTPICNTINYKYYKKGNGIIHEVSTEKDFKEIIKKSLDNKINYIYLKINNNANYNMDSIIQDTLIENRLPIMINYSYKSFEDSIKLTITYLNT